MKGERVNYRKHKSRTSPNLLHCWQNRCRVPPTSTTWALAWYSHTLCLLWYCFASWRSALHFSAWQHRVMLPLPLLVPFPFFFLSTSGCPFWSFIITCCTLSLLVAFASDPSMCRAKREVWMVGCNLFEGGIIWGEKKKRERCRGEGEWGSEDHKVLHFLFASLKKALFFFSVVGVHGTVVDSESKAWDSHYLYLWNQWELFNEFGVGRVLVSGGWQLW